MVQLMKTDKASPGSDFLRGEMVPVKLEVEDALEDKHGPLNKRSKLSTSLPVRFDPSQQNLQNGVFPVPPSQYNPLDEPSPLGLRLRKSPSLLDLIQMRLSQGNASKTATNSKKDQKSTLASSSTDKLKASNFPATLLRIGTWEYKSRYEGDLVAKCYFAKHKLVWEVLDGGLKNKIEIQWSDIMALKGNYPDDEPGTLVVVLARQPLFYRETNPQPRKHTIWQATSDFTGGQASICRQHYLQCSQGLLGKHFEKLIQCDPRLNFLSQQEETPLESPYFDARISMFDDSNECENTVDLNSEDRRSFLDMRDAASPSGAQSSSSKNEQDLYSRSTGGFPHETPPHSSVSTDEVEGTRSKGLDELKVLSNWDQIKVPGLHPSMSMSDLVSQLEHRISEQRTSNNPSLSSEEQHSLEILEEITRCLFTDNTQFVPDSVEKSLMSRVNSLCCLLQKDPAAHGFPNGDRQVSESNEVVIPEGPPMSRKDSVGELLLNLPRIASLPQFLFNISEDYENQAR